MVKVRMGKVVADMTVPEFIDYQRRQGVKVAASEPKTQKRGGNGNKFTIDDAKTIREAVLSVKGRRVDWRKLHERIPSHSASSIMVFAYNKGFMKEAKALRTKEPEKLKKNTAKVTGGDIVESFPRFATIGDDCVLRLEQLSKELIANKGSKMTFPNAGRHLGIVDGLHWRSFVQEFMMRKSKVAAYFGAPDKFRLVIIGEKYHEIHYEEGK